MPNLLNNRPNQFNASLASIVSSLGTKREAEENKLIRKFSPLYAEFIDKLFQRFETKNRKRADLTQIFEERLFELLKASFVFGAFSAIESLGFNQLGQTIKFDLTNSKILRTLRARARSSSLQIYATSLFKFKHSSDAERYVKKSKIWRPLLIVQREFAFGFSLARWEVFKRAKVQRKRWVSVQDNRKRVQHKQNEEVGWIDFNARFPSGSLSPGIRDEDSFGCRCVMDADVLSVFEPYIWVGN